jgi:hypothetical protein
VVRYGSVAVLFALGLMAKPQVITFPFLLLLWDYWPLRRAGVRFSLFALRQNATVEASGERRRANGEWRTANSQWRFLILEKLPLLCIAAGSAVMTMKAQSAAGAVLTLGAVPLSLRLSNAIVAYLKYIQKVFWPVKLAPMYPHPANLLRAWQVYTALFVLLAITTIVWEQRRRRYPVVGWLWFLGTMVPMIGLVQVGRQAMADRYAYLPLIGIFIMICWGIADWLEQRRAARVLLPAAGVLAVVVLAVVARHQIGYWADNQLL